MIDTSAARSPGRLPASAARRLERYAERLDEYEKGLVASRGDGGISGEEKLREHLGNLFGSVNGYTGRPTDSELRRMQDLGAELAEGEAQFAELTSESELSRMQRDLERAELEPLKVMTWEEWEAKREAGG
ncbi:MAG: hypothetical protein AMS25_13210 [Gemmatimonas sp. SM23_52]|nr:MAG: hypothetical protein AMS25_13210 [Gemmatimonas sp. SM23_52]